MSVFFSNKNGIKCMFLLKLFSLFLTRLVHKIIMHCGAGGNENENEHIKNADEMCRCYSGCMLGYVYGRRSQSRQYGQYEQGKKISIENHQQNGGCGRYHSGCNVKNNRVAYFRNPAVLFYRTTRTACPSILSMYCENFVPKAFPSGKSSSMG